MSRVTLSSSMALGMAEVVYSIGGLFGHAQVVVMQVVVALSHKPDGGSQP